MTSGEYIKHSRNLGKLCYLYDNASTNSTAMNQHRAATLDQIADDLIVSLPLVDSFAPFSVRWASAISQGSDALKTIAVQAAQAYVITTAFTGDLTTVIAGTITATKAMEALATDMSAGVDNVTFSTLTTSGLCNFLNQVAGAVQTWHTAADVSATYKDSVYVVTAVLP